MFSFQDPRLPEPLAKAIEKMGFKEATPVQAKAIPVIFEGQDLIACAQTGSGKTAAYLLPVLTSLLSDESSIALVLVPTRELAKQISDVLRNLTNFTPGLRSVVLIGGSDMQKQLQGLKRQPRVIVATPGRLTDHLRRSSNLLKTVSHLILDEGDRMLDMGFAPQLDVILNYLPERRQTLLFSATLDAAVRKLAHKYLKSPVSVTIGEESQPVERITQKGIPTTNAGKNELLLNELNAREGSILIFTRTQVRTDRVTRYLEEYGFKVARIHGGRSQGQRNSALAGFREGKFRVLVATDIAARGIDVPQIAHVINYDLPMMDEDYVHRIGRTARAGASGEAISFLTPEDAQQWRGLVRKFRIQGDAANVMGADKGGDRQAPWRQGKPSGNRDRRGGPSRGNGGGGQQRHGAPSRGGGNRPAGPRADNRNSRPAPWQKNDRGPKREGRDDRHEGRRDEQRAEGGDIANSFLQSEGRPERRDDRRGGGQRPERRGDRRDDRREQPARADNRAPQRRDEGSPRRDSTGSFAPRNSGPSRPRPQA